MENSGNHILLADTTPVVTMQWLMVLGLAIKYTLTWLEFLTSKQSVLYVVEINKELYFYFISGVTFLRYW